MDLGFFLRSAWLFIVGVIVAVIGVYMLLMVPEIGSNSFIIMLIGLFFTGAGSIYGKRRLRGEYYMATEERDIVKKEKPKPVDRPGEAGESEEFLEEAEQAEEKRTEAPEIETSKPRLEATGEPEEHVRVIKVLLCPKCGTENKETDIFCYNCGKKLRLKGFPEKEKKGKK